MVSEHTWHLTADGRAVPEDDPTGVTLLVGQGCEMDERTILLVTEASNADETEASRRKGK